MSRSYPKEVRLRTRLDFRRFAQPYTRLVGKAIIVEINKQALNLTRLGITVTKKYGKANLRNRFKRIVREAFRHTLSQIPQGFDLNVKPRSEAYQATSKEIEAELLHLLNSPYAHTPSSRPYRPQSGTAPGRTNGQRPTADSRGCRERKNTRPHHADGLSDAPSSGISP